MPKNGEPRYFGVAGAHPLLLTWRAHHADTRRAAGRSGRRRGFRKAGSCPGRSAHRAPGNIRVPRGVETELLVQSLATMVVFAGVSIGGGCWAVVGEQLAQFGAQVLDLEIVRDGDEAALPQFVAVVYGNAGACASVHGISKTETIQTFHTSAEASDCCTCPNLSFLHNGREAIQPARPLRPMNRTNRELRWQGTAGMQTP